MRNYSKSDWTEAENALLQEYYYTLSMAELRRILPGRTETEMRKQVQSLERKNKTFVKNFS